MGSYSCTDCFALRKGAPIPIKFGGWVGARAGPEILEKVLFSLLGVEQRLVDCPILGPVTVSDRSGPPSSRLYK